MKRAYWIVLFCGLFLLATAADSIGADKYYARCNLKVVKGKEISWVNWQAASTYIPVGTPLKVLEKNRTTAVIYNEKKDRKYNLDMGAGGDEYLEKFLTKKPPNLSKYPKTAQEKIKEVKGAMGMTKEEVYLAMGPPAWVSVGDTQNMTYKEIMKYDLWKYPRRRFGINIEVRFHPETGKVDRTVGMWL